MSFFDGDLLLTGRAAQDIYAHIKDLPIIDYHCHLNEGDIAADRRFENIGELWLAGDHYKWRAMRLCGVDEHYITGNATWRERFDAFVGIMPQLLGNPLYYWSHMELSRVFGIKLPICPENADAIWQAANERLKTLTVRGLLSHFGVEFIATTDHPMSSLSQHGKIDDVTVSPTFRPDAALAEGMDKGVLEQRLDYFVAHGCRIADHGFDNVTSKNEDNLLWLMRVCHERGLVLQLHVGTMRNINSVAHRDIGPDSGFDVMRGEVLTDALAAVLDRASAGGFLPRIVLYTLNDAYARPLATLCGAFRGVLMGAAWWFNDTVEGIRRQLLTVSEYAALGTNLGMLTDSRSFLSYVRFDFFRRILASFIGERVDRGEYDAAAAPALAARIAYYNVKETLDL